MKLIEFAIATDLKNFSPQILLINCDEISSFEQIKNNKHLCKIKTKIGDEYFVYGNYKTITNRFFYTLSKKINTHEDDIIRPSIRVFHRNSLLEPDVAFLDPIQLKAFIYGIDENFPIENIPKYTLESFSLIK